ncbi:interferon gamma receptor 2 precursor [Scleropages formosus]|uniref:Fibronectin type-III domain-containing protein n=1 Tax=Scleropages formosus TaxID=113540 RepID=A0A8C9SEW0_SCLFO|nr:interferon gamma receptor 2 precursor [Scleropages formosus]
MMSKCIFEVLLFLQLFVGGGSLIQSPQHVRIESYNLRSVLRWSPVESDGNTPVQYLVQYTVSGMGEWRDVSSCAPTLVTQCNISYEARPYIKVTFRVQAQAGNQTSSWSPSKPFNAHLQTHLGPPSIRLSTENPNTLTVVVEPDASLKKEYGDQLSYRVFIGQENENLTNHSDHSSTVIVRPLKGGVKYCVQVHYVIEQRLGDSTGKTCTIVKQSEEERIIRAVLLSSLLVALFGGLILGFIFIVYKNYDKIKYVLRPTLQFQDYIEEFLFGERFTQLSQLNSNNPNTEETCDRISLIFTDTNIVENV